ncbi:hypothetical protein DY000_02063289 [Brassica cretica]|uniref:Uncharacterized protein n=1 Tax=Brassica cretica TaxID=69181 RepID=A0ABQ7AR24_BRACR|nr:hypothetical protein DY000_02063289 [Brassica cretica]
MLNKPFIIPLGTQIHDTVLLELEVLVSQRETKRGLERESRSRSEFPADGWASIGLVYCSVFLFICCFLACPVGVCGVPSFGVFDWFSWFREVEATSDPPTPSCDSGGGGSSCSTLPVFVDSYIVLYPLKMKLFSPLKLGIFECEISSVGKKRRMCFRWCESRRGGCATCPVYTKSLTRGPGGAFPWV